MSTFVDEHRLSRCGWQSLNQLFFQEVLLCCFDGVEIMVAEVSNWS
jgi:hypothetical protein